MIVTLHHITEFPFARDGEWRSRRLFISSTAEYPPLIARSILKSMDNLAVWVSTHIIVTKASIALASTPLPTHHYGRDVYHPNAITEAMSQLQSESSSCLCLNLYPVQIYGTEIPKTQNLKLPCRYQCTRSGDESKFDRHLTCHLPTHTPRFSLHHYAYDLLDACEISIDVL